MSTAGERESYEALRSSYIHLLSFFDTSAVHLIMYNNLRKLKIA